METVKKYSPHNPAELGIVRTYDSWHEAIDHALDMERTIHDGGWDTIEGGRLGSRMLSEGDRWDLGCDWDRTCEMVRADGWAEGLELVSEMSESFEGVIGSRMLSHEPQYHVSGACVDVAAYLTGEPECFLDFAEVEKPGAGKVLSIGVDILLEASDNAIMVMRRGAAIVALIDMLEAAGYQTEIWLLGKTQRRGVSGTIKIPLKWASEPVPMERAAFALCHPAMARRILFALEEQYPREFRTLLDIVLDGRYGGVGELDASDFDGDILLSSSYAPFISREAAHKWLLRTLKDNGIEFAQSPDALSVP